MSTDTIDVDESSDPIDVIDRYEQLFETIREEADDPRIARRYGEQPLELLELDRKQGGQS